ncbi:hypothetical protein A7Q26_14000 [Sphingobium sp. TCM1]|nr:hypothetical protein A7Q26_14000 [Sphingobium sp. TCM1]
MDEQAPPAFRTTQRIESSDMLGTDSVGIAFGLDQPDLAFDHDLPINSAITSVAAVSNNPMPAPLETFEQQFLERQRIHGPQTRIEKLGWLQTVSAA